LVFNIPNILSLFRLILVFVFPFAFFKGNMLWGLLVFVVASATDWLDGMIARKTNSITDIGKVLDPLADKMMLIMALVCLFIRGKIPTVVLIVMGAKELGMVIGGIVLYSKKMIIPAMTGGKLATVTFFVGVVLTFLGDYLPWVGQVATIILYVAMFIALGAAVQYGLVLLRRQQEKKNAGG
jgi:cardiolipin synthase